MTFGKGLFARGMSDMISPGRRSTRTGNPPGRVIGPNHVWLVTYRLHFSILQYQRMSHKHAASDQHTDAGQGSRGRKAYELEG